MPNGTVIVFTGENEYALRTELLRWKKSFEQKHGSENMLTLTSKEVTLSALLDAVQTMPFIAEKRLVVVEGIPKLEKEDCKELTASVHPQTVLLFADPKPDKRLSSVKELLATSDVKLFEPLAPAALLAWMKSEAVHSGSVLQDAAARELLSIAGEDQWTLGSEIHKLACFKVGSEITPADVDALAVPAGAQVVWRLTDLIGNQKAPEALQFLQRQIDRGEDPYGMWAILLNMLKNLTFVKAALDEGHRDERAISAATGIHFFAVRGLLPLARTRNMADLKTLVDFAATADLELKTGGYHYSSDRPDEVVALAEHIILSCA